MENTVCKLFDPVEFAKGLTPAEKKLIKKCWYPKSGIFVSNSWSLYDLLHLMETKHITEDDLKSVATLL